MKSRAPGFALIQTIVSIVILAGALAGSVALMGTILNETATNKNRITALYLAQECLELTRNLRDSAWKQNLPLGCVFPPDRLKFQIAPSEAIPSTQDNRSLLCQSEMGSTVSAFEEKNPLFIHNSLFTHSAEMDGIPIPFERYVTVNETVYVDDDATKPLQKINLTCEVSWQEGRDTQVVTLSHILTNWDKK